MSWHFQCKWSRSRNNTLFTKHEGMCSGVLSDLVCGRCPWAGAATVPPSQETNPLQTRVKSLQKTMRTCHNLFLQRIFLQDNLTLFSCFHVMQGNDWTRKSIFYLQSYTLNTRLLQGVRILPCEEQRGSWQQKMLMLFLSSQNSF